MDAQAVAEVLAKPYSQQLMQSAIPARFAYIGLDGDPRVIPIGFLYEGGKLIICTVPTSAKVPALRKNPRVSITIDTEAFPPKVLLIRGSVELELVDGVPDEYITASKKVVPADQRAEWEGSVRALYDQMVRITLTPDWAKLLDFETTLPKSVEDLIRAKSPA